MAALRATTVIRRVRPQTSDTRRRERSTSYRVSGLVQRRGEQPRASEREPAACSTAKLGHSTAAAFDLFLRKALGYPHCGKVTYVNLLSARSALETIQGGFVQSNRHNLGYGAPDSGS